MARQTPLPIDFLPMIDRLNDQVDVKRGFPDVGKGDVFFPLLLKSEGQRFAHPCGAVER